MSAPKVGFKFVVSAFLRALRSRTFERYKGVGFVLERGKTFNHVMSSLVYKEDGHEYHIPTEEGANGERYVFVEDMGALSPVLGVLPLQEKLRIARNIRDALLSQNFDCQVIYDHHPVDD